MKTHNSKTDVKLNIRRRLIGGIDNPSVLELFTGPGKMRQAFGGAKIVGMDLDTKSEAEFLGDCTYLTRCMDLSSFNVFDADAFSMPWHVLYIIASRRQKKPGEKILIFGTDGGFGGMANKVRTFRKRGWSIQMMDAIGVTPDDEAKPVINGQRKAERVTIKLIESFFGEWEISRFLSAWGGGSGGTLYFGAELR